MTREDREPLRHFQLALASIVVPYVTFVVSGLLAIAAWRSVARAPTRRAWARRLTALAVIDVLVAFTVIGVATGHLDLERASASDRDRPRIGVALDPADPGGGAHIVGVVEDSPAGQAGVRPGDVVIAIDERPIERDADLLDAIRSGAVGQPRRLKLRRDGIERELTVAASATLPRREPLFKPLPDSGPRELGGITAMIAVECLVVAALCAIAASRATGALRVWIAFSSAIAGSQLVAAGTGIILERLLGGASVGAWLLAIAAGALALIAIAVLARWRLERRAILETAPATRRAGVGATVAFGLGYLVAGGARVAVLLAALVALSSRRIPTPGRELEELVAHGIGPVGIALLATCVVVLAPIGEETLFRGVLLPWLGRSMPAEAAVWASATVFALAHLHYGPFMVVVLLYGLVLGWARLESGGLKAPMILHGIINSAVLALTLIHR